jgi:threonine/homoserine/homoserine lactone efflux protein
MNEISSLLGIAAALCIGAASPGPSFVMVARTAASAGRAQGLRAALGMGLGALLFAVASLLGLNAVFLAVPAVYIALKFSGGLYLAYLGFRIWRGARQPLDVSASDFKVIPPSPSQASETARHEVSWGYARA